VLAPNAPLRAAAITFGREVAVGIGLTTGRIAVKLRLMVSLIPYMGPVGLEH
jgi:hypothetical protein